MEIGIEGLVVPPRWGKVSSRQVSLPGYIYLCKNVCRSDFLEKKFRFARGKARRILHGCTFAFFFCCIREESGPRNLYIKPTRFNRVDINIRSIRRRRKVRFIPSFQP